MAAFDGKYRNVLSEKYRAGEYAFGHISPASVMGFSLLSEMEFFAVPKNGISLNI